MGCAASVSEATSGARLLRQPSTDSDAHVLRTGATLLGVAESAVTIATTRRLPRGQNSDGVFLHQVMAGDAPEAPLTIVQKIAHSDRAGHILEALEPGAGKSGLDYPRLYECQPLDQNYSILTSYVGGIGELKTVISKGRCRPELATDIGENLARIALIPRFAPGVLQCSELFSSGSMGFRFPKRQKLERVARGQEPILGENGSLLPEIGAIAEKYEKIKQVIANSPVIFSHNDLHANNIGMVRDDDGVRLCAVDWDVSRFNFAGMDLIRFICSDSSVGESSSFSHRICSAYYDGLRSYKLIDTTYDQLILVAYLFALQRSIGLVRRRGRATLALRRLPRLILGLL